VQQTIFDEIRGVWIADETPSRVFDISSQSKRKLGCKIEVSKVKSSKSMQMKTGYLNLSHGCDFLCINLSLRMYGITLTVSRVIANVRYNIDGE